MSDITSFPFVAFLDSGTGGIPYMLHLQKKYPHIRCVYLGDTANFPYGEKTREEITECACSASRLLIENFNPDAIVIACNTISVTALSALRERFSSLPFVGTVPAIKLAASLSKKRRIGLLATRQTVSNPYTDKLIEDFASDCFIARRGDPDLIDFVEKKLFTASPSERLAAIAPAVEFFRGQDVDTIILGCTHFIHLADDIQKAAGKDILVVDSREGVVNQTLRVLDQVSQAKKNTRNVENMTFYITGVRDALAEEEYRTLARNLKIPYGGKLI